MTTVIDPPAADPAEPDAPWRLGLFLKNDPLAPLHIITSNETTGAPNTTHLVGVNQCFAAGLNPVDAHTQANFSFILNAFRASCEQYRLNALSVTAVFIGATLTDQGSVISAQVSDAHQEAFTYHPNASQNDQLMQASYLITQRLPTPDTLVMGASPYVRKAKEGVYVPYKIQCPGKISSTDNLCLTARTNNAFTALQSDWSAAAHDGYPYGNILANGHTPALWLRPADDNLSATWFTGLARTTSFRVTYRICLEMLTRPDSLLAPFAELPALPDEHAMKMYYEIASRMKDAYASDDNDKGSLWDKVKSVAKGLWGVVSPAIAAAVPGGSLAVKAINTAVPLASKVIGALGDAKQAKEAAAKARSLVERATPAAAPAAAPAKSRPKRRPPKNLVKNGPVKARPMRRLPADNN